MEKQDQGYPQQPDYNSQVLQQSQPPHQFTQPGYNLQVTQQPQLPHQSAQPYQQYPPPQSTTQGYPQQHGYPPQQQISQAQMAPPPYSEATKTEQPMSYTTGAPPTIMQPTSYQQNTVVVAGVGVTQPQQVYHGPPPPNHMAFSILTCLFCFWPLGLFAIIKSSEVNSAIAMGDYFRAKIASESAKRMSIISLIIGCVAYVCLSVYFIFMVSVVQ